MKRVVITGATGFIGSWLVKEMINNSIEVIALVRDCDCNGVNDCLNSSLVRKVCISNDADTLRYELVSDRSIDAFYHLAWGGVSTEQKNDTEMQLDNIALAVKMLELASVIGVSKFIATGTVAEYAFCEGVMDVNAKQTPNDMYGAAKVATHYLLETKARLINMPFNWVVIPSTFGEGRRDKNIITYTIESLLSGNKPSYGYLQQMWDFLYVSEVVRALRMIGETGIAGKNYAIGSGVYKPLKKYIEIIRDEINPDLELGIGDMPSFSDKAFSSCVCIDELTKDTGFIPEITFEEGIGRTIEYFKGYTGGEA